MCSCGWIDLACFLVDIYTYSTYFACLLTMNFCYYLTLITNITRNNLKRFRNSKLSNTCEGPNQTMTKETKKTCYTVS